MNRINICFATDNNYAKYMGLALMSVLKSANKEDNLHFFILDNNIKQEEKDKIATLQKIKPFEITYIPINEGMFKGCHFREGKITVTTYARFLAPKLINEDKLLYLDCDIFVRKSLAPFFNIDVSNYYMAGVCDIGMNRNYIANKFNGAIIPENYINAGVLLINNKKFKEENIADTLLKYAAENSLTLKYADQDCLNYVLREGIKLIDPTWNAMDSYFDPYVILKQKNKFDLLSIDPAVRHFKPWKVNNAREFREEYIGMMKESPWKEFTPKDDLSLKNFLKILYRYWLRYPAFFLTPKFYIRVKYLGFKNTILRVID
ncbi:MAG: glycosyltransferase family 8 protein [Elusimicrobiaceae bacterium]|nr:glycosyltransferase family 8 protein [Elusimicrobiaceae bacterium]